MSTTFISNGTGQAMIFLHGIGSTGRVWQNQVDYFSKDYLCIGLDLPGFGGTPALPENTFEAICHWLKALIDEQGWTDPIVVGNSYGGMILQEFLYHYPTVAKAAVLFGTSPAFGKGEWQDQFIRDRLQPIEDGLTMAQLAPDMVKAMTGSGSLPEGREAVLEDTARVTEDAYRTALLTLPEFDRRKNLANISIPTLLLVGLEDENSPAAMMKKTAGYIPNSTYVEMEALGHMAHVGNPPRFNQALEAFLGTI